MKKKTEEILEKIRTLMLSEKFKIIHRSNKQNFIRDRLVTFHILIICILNLMRRSLQSELNNFAKITGLSVISKQTFSAARKKRFIGKIGGWKSAIKGDD